MRLGLDQLPAAIGRGLVAAYLVSGDEPLLVGEAADRIREAARAAGYSDRRVFFIDRSFDWDELRHESRAMSLFSDRRVFDMRLPSGKAEAGAALLEELASTQVPDVIFLMVTGKLDKKVAESNWVRAFERHGVWIPVWPVETAALPAWLQARAKQANLTVHPDAAQLIAERVEGNLLSANQELEKLKMLAGGAAISVDLVLQSVGDSARYNVFQLAEAAAAGDPGRALHILLGLKSEGIEPTLILWALSRELRGLFQARERARLRSNERGAGWNLASNPAPRALARIAKLSLAALLTQASQTDKVIKGLAVGDAWTFLTALTAGFAGAGLAGSLQAPADSGRVGV